jgi:hypothetical protein
MRMTLQPTARPAGLRRARAAGGRPAHPRPADRGRAGLLRLRALKPFPCRPVYFLSDYLYNIYIRGMRMTSPPAARLLPRDLPLPDRADPARPGGGGGSRYAAPRAGKLVDITIHLYAE